MLYLYPHHVPCQQGARNGFDGKSYTWGEGEGRRGGRGGRREGWGRGGDKRVKDGGEESGEEGGREDQKNLSAKKSKKLK